MNDDEKRILASKLIKSINYDADGMMKYIVFNFAILGKETKIKEIYDSNQSIEYVYEITDVRIIIIKQWKKPMRIYIKELIKHLNAYVMILL